MSIQIPLTGIVSNDLVYQLALTYQGEPLNLNDYTITVYLKASQTTPDGDATTFTPATVEALAGTCTWTVGHAGNATAGTFWYRVDAVNGSGDVATCIFGVLTILAA